ncbi:MAG: hypothetical protein AAFO81_05025 [Pseudomonadota bacterium]
MYSSSKLYCAILAIAISAIGLSKPAFAGGQAQTGCDRQEVTEFWETDITGQAVSGKGTLCVGKTAVSASMQVKGLTPGGAYTSWWVYIDDPASCADFPLPAPGVIPFPEPEDYAGRCGLADFFTADASGEFLNPLVVFGRMDGLVVGKSGKASLRDRWRDFTPSPGSQIWLFVFGHGPAASDDNRALARQLLTPEDPLSGAPHLGIEGSPNGYPSAVVVFDID